MEDHDAKKTDQTDKTDHASDIIEDLPQKAVTDRDAESLKGGRAVLSGDESPKE